MFYYFRNLYTICLFFFYFFLLISLLISIIILSILRIPSSHIGKFYSSVTKPTHLELDNGQAQARSTNGKILIGRLVA